MTGKDKSHSGAKPIRESAIRESALREIREQLRGFEDSQLAEVAETLARAAEIQERNLERLDTLEHDILTPERAAAALGYVGADGRVMIEAFEKMSAKNGWPRRKLSSRRFVYIRAELMEAIRNLPG